MLHVIGAVVVAVILLVAIGTVGLGRLVWRLGVLVAIAWLLMFALMFAISDSAAAVMVAFFTWGIGGAGAVLAFAGLLAWVFGGFTPRMRS